MWKPPVSYLKMLCLVIECLIVFNNVLNSMSFQIKGMFNLSKASSAFMTKYKS